MAGGRGERFWPASRQRRPKHLLPIVGTEPMLAQTIQRLAGLIPPERVLVITNADQAATVAEVCPELPIENIIAEPVGRDTAAAVGLAQVLVRQRDPDGVLAMLPADAAIDDGAGFRQSLAAAFAAAEAEAVIVTIGIPPTFPATGYGYIERGAFWRQFAGLPVHQVAQFREKPDARTAEVYLATGRFAWNAGIFVFRAATVAACFADHTPALHTALEAIGAALAAGSPLDAVLAVHYPTLQKISVDYAIIEPASREGRIVTLDATFDWDDVGEWPAVSRHYPKDSAGNVVKGRAWVFDGHNNLVCTEGTHRVTLLGCEGLVVVQTADATLVCPKERAQDVKALVKALGSHPDWKDLV